VSALPFDIGARMWRRGSVLAVQGRVEGLDDLYAIPCTSDGHNACMDPNQTKIIELLREVHLIAFKEIERFNMRVVELENQHRQPTRTHTGNRGMGMWGNWLFLKNTR
jgi:hypothetical protein